MFQTSFWPALCAFAAVSLATLVVIEFGIYAANRYRERYLQEAGIELDDILIQMPAGRVLDLSLGLSVSGMLLTVIALATLVDGFPWQYALLIGPLVAVGLFPLPRLLLRQLRRRRLDKFNVQLEDALGTISSSLKAGFSINQALEEVAEQEIHPLAIEFRLLVQEIRLGVPLEQALENMNRRLESSDFELVASAILTARQTGGELTGTLERVAGLIRERGRITNKVRAVTAMGRLQAWAIGLAPFALLIGMYHVNPLVMRGFLNSWAGGLSLVAVMVLDCCGIIMIRKITRIDV